MDPRPKTIICDIDGTLIEHYGNAYQQLTRTPEILPGVLKKFEDWDRKGYNIILITGRRENWRKETEKQLVSLGIFYDQLIMGVGGGPRILINDFKPNSKEPTAIAHCLDRNSGMETLEDF
tara:strand:- start:621 stop:983 length:363 start_codon:yes stop_codon:yes gene_type:complete